MLLNYEKTLPNACEISEKALPLHSLFPKGLHPSRLLQGTAVVI